MARRPKDAPIDLTKKHDLTAGLIDALRCPEGREQVFLRDDFERGLRVRVTPTGAKSFVFESKVNGITFRRTLGLVQDLTIPEARSKADDLRKLVKDNKDPREEERKEAARQATAEAERAREQAAAEAERAREQAERDKQAAETAAAEAARAITVAEAWSRYLAERRPHWGERHYADHVTMTHEGGRPRRRLSGAVTKPGPLHSLMSVRLVDLDAQVMEDWAKKEAATRPARVRLALRAFKAFLRWAAAEKAYAELVNPAAASAKKVREAAGKTEAKDDCLLSVQLRAWFTAVRAIPNPVTAAYLQTLLLTGARPGEVLELRWDDINPEWNSISIRDKVEGERQIPLTPYVWSLLSGLPRRNQWVFSSTRGISPDPKLVHRRERYHKSRGTLAPVGTASTASASGRLMEPGFVHRRACAAAGLQGLTLHGLRRSFASLTEWLEVPAGVVAQIQGHKPSATAEKHYKRRPLDLLRVWHVRIEAWILEQAGVQFEAKAAPAAGLRVVAAA